MFDESPRSTGPSPDGISPEISPAAENGVIEIAQAPTAGGETIGQISATQGSAFITRTDGSKVPAADGTSIFQGDLVETNTGGAVGITFADESTFSLAENGSMVIDEMVYDPGSQSGKSTVNIAQGIFTFVSGQIAKTSVDAMLIKTPVAVIGIRGTAGGGEAGPEGTPNTYSMFQDPNTGEVGEMTLRTNGGTTTFNSANQTSVIISKYVPPTIPVTLPTAAVAQFYAKAAATGQKSFIAPPPASANEAAAQKAAGDAFSKAITEGKSPAEAISTASDAGRKTAVEAVLADNPEAYGTEKSAESISDGQKSNILDKVAGRTGDPIDPGTGKGANFSEGLKSQLGGSIEILLKPPDEEVTEDAAELAEESGEGGEEGDEDVVPDFFEAVFFDEIIGNFFEEVFLEDIIDDFFEDVFFDDFLFGGGDGDFFEDAILFGFDDPFSFQDDFFFDDAFFFGGPGDEEFIFFEDETDFFFDPVVFGDEFDLTSGADNLLGGAGNTEFIVDQGLFGAGVYGGNDVINDSGGTRDRITFEGVDNVLISIAEKSGAPSRVLINVATLTGPLNIINTTNDVLSPLASPVNTIDVTKDVEDLQALDSDFTSFDSGGVLLFGALNVTGSQTGYIVAGSDAQNDIINLSGFNDSATTLGSIIFGKGGNDTLTGTVSEDDLIGGAGDDTLDGGGGANVLDGDSGTDTINVTVASSVNDIDGGIGTDTLNYGAAAGGSDFANTFTFGTFGSLALTRSGLPADVVFGIEVLNAGDLVDTFNFNTISLGFTTIDGGGGNDTFTFNTAGAQIAAVIDGNTGTDSITLNADTFLAGTGGVRNVETINGSAGNDTVNFIGTTATTIDGRAGDDTLTGGSAADTLIGGTGNDTLSGAGGNDIFQGGTGNDTINLGASDGVADIVKYGSFSDGATDLTAANADSVNQFETANDTFNFLNGALALNGTTVASVASGAADLTGTDGVFYINNATAADLSNLSNVVGAIGTLVGIDAGDKAIFAVRSSGTSGIYAFTDGNNDTTIDASELQLLGVVDALIDNTDLAVVGGA